MVERHAGDPLCFEVAANPLERVPSLGFTCGQERKFGAAAAGCSPLRNSGLGHVDHPGRPAGWKHGRIATSETKKCFIEIVGFRPYRPYEGRSMAGLADLEKAWLVGGLGSCELHAKEVGRESQDARRIGNHTSDIDNGSSLRVLLNKLEDTTSIGHPHIDRVSRIDAERRVSASKEGIDHLFRRPHHEEPPGLRDERRPEVEKEDRARILPAPGTIRRAAALHELSRFDPRRCGQVDRLLAGEAVHAKPVGCQDPLMQVIELEVFKMAVGVTRRRCHQRVAKLHASGREDRCRQRRARSVHPTDHQGWRVSVCMVAIHAKRPPFR